MSRPIQTDIFPQQASFSVAESAADTTTTARINLPISRLPNQSRVQVIEITKIWLEFSNNQSATGDSVGAALCFRDFGTTDALLSDPACFFKFRETAIISTNGGFIHPITHEFDLTTGGGRGFLIATDSIFAQVQSASIGSAVTVRFKIWYRFVQVGLQEYIGIVQQQSSLT